MRALSFTSESILAYQQGRKSQTRRVIASAGNRMHIDKLLGEWSLSSTPYQYDGTGWNGSALPWNWQGKKPPQVGDWLWELQCDVDDSATTSLGHPYKAGDHVPFLEGYQITSSALLTTHVSGHYLADDAPFRVELTRQEFAKWERRKFPFRATPGRFMYRSLVRYRPEILSEKVERAQEISEEDARAEGVAPLFSHDDIHLPHYRAELDHDPMPYQNYLWHGHIGDGITAKQSDAWEWQYSGYKNARDSFSSLWEKINAKRGFGWDVNPFAWVVEFEKVEVGE